MADQEAPDLKIVNNEDLQRWEAHVGHYKGVAEYQLSGDTLVLMHTEVPPELEGKGIAGRLMQAALDDARTRQLAVVPFCRYAAGFIRRNPEYKTLVPRQYRELLSEQRDE